MDIKKKEEKMCALKERIKAVELHFRYGRKASAAIRELGYPDCKILAKWVREYEETGKLHGRCAVNICFAEKSKKARNSGCFEFW